MHPAHTLPVSTVTMGAGVQSNFVLGDGAERIEAARAAAGAQSSLDSDAENQSYLDGTVAHVMFAPGLAPWVGARVGLGYDTEAGLAYTGRTARVDARHAFEARRIALSAGLGASAVLTRRGEEGADSDPVGRGEAIPGLDTHGLTGWGLDVPVIVGWRSDADLVQIYGGLRGGYERVFGDVGLGVSFYDVGAPSSAELDASRWYGSLLAGLRTTVDPLWVGIELAAGVGYGEGSMVFRDAAGGTTAHVNGSATGINLSPSGAFGGRF